MLEQITISFNWRAILKISLVWAAEYTLLALIEDSSTLLKVATMICALGGLVVLQLENVLRHYDRRLFLGLAGSVAIIYLGFVGYALHQADARSANKEQLREFYVKAGPLFDRVIPTHGAANAPVLDEIALKKFQEDVKAWEHTTEQWLLINLGPAARERFLDMSSVQTICWSQVIQGCDSRYDIPKNRLSAEKRNLSAIMETTAYGP